LFSSTKGVSSLNGGAYNGSESFSNRREFYFNSLWQANYNKVINKHAINLNANMEYNHARLEIGNVTQRGLIDGVYVPNTGAGYVGDVATNDLYGAVASASRLRNDLISYFGSADYDFDKKYGLVASLRYDGTSRFINDQRWGTFYSIGGRWNIDEEAFMNSVSMVDDLKLRGSYGTVGNQRIVAGTLFAGINPPGFSDIYTISNNTYNGAQGYQISFGFPDLKWETTTQWNIGADFEMWNRRLKGSFDYYNKKTSDLFLNNPVTPTSGTPSLTRNTDVLITNSGIELNLAYDLINYNDMKFTIKANGAKNNNKVSNYKLNNGQLFTSDGFYVSQNGGRINEPFVFHYIGVNPANGNLLFEDANGNPTENPVQSDKKAAGVNYLPVYQGGFGFDFDYKGFFASTLFTYALDVKRFDSDYASLFDTSAIGNFVVSSELLNAWTNTNTTSNVPALKAANLGLSDQSDRFLMDASYLRIRNVQIGYKVPTSFLERSFIKSLSFILQAENLYNFTKWKGFDPESSRTADYASYPTSKIVTFGLDLKF
jgi:TonB-linked SusC/RagA family outer membrane protein